MNGEIEMHKSRKHGFTDVSVIVTRDKISYLRIVGKHPRFRVMTATASEDDRSFRVCTDKVRLASAALRFGAHLRTGPSRAQDSSGRDFIHICTLSFSSPELSKDDEAQLYSALEKFFEIYDSYSSSAPENKNELKQVYDVLAIDGSGAEVYLGDGVWLGGDGSLQDLGR